MTHPEWNLKPMLIRRDSGPIMDRALLCHLWAMGLAVLTAAGPSEQTGVPPYPDHMKLLVVRDLQGNERPVKTVADWEIRRGHILAHLQEVMGPLPGKEKRCALDVKVLETHRERGFTSNQAHLRQRAGRSSSRLAAGA